MAGENRDSFNLQQEGATTRKLAAVTGVLDVQTPLPAEAEVQAAPAVEISRVTGKLPVLDVLADETPAVVEPAPVAATVAVPTEQSPRDEDLSATLLSDAVRPGTESRPRRNTLASMTRPRNEQGEATPPPPNRTVVFSEPRAQRLVAPEDIVDEIDDWEVADQPTVLMPPDLAQKVRPQFLQTGEVQSWPPRPGQGAPATPGRARPGIGGIPNSAGSPSRERKLAAPDGRLMPGVPTGVPQSALPNPRMQRFQELRAQRATQGDEEHMPGEAASVATTVREWWHDISPVLRKALHYQHEARASGMYPIPAYAEDPGPITRMGDAFGRLAATARDVSERAQQAAAPTLKRIQEQAGHARTFLEEKIDGTPTRQQAPFLGPGRVAIFFRQGVTVGQAQRLLTANAARPLRIIPRKHGFLVLVRPGTEAQTAERLREHPYVRDVAYLDYDESAAAGR